MSHDSGQKGDSSGHCMCGGGCSDREGEAGVEVGVCSGQTEERKSLSSWKALCTEMDMGLEFSEKQKARLAGTEGWPSSSVRFEAGKVGKASHRVALINRNQRSTP